MSSGKPDRRVRGRITAYLAQLPPDARRAVKKLRTTIREAAPRAIEHFSYGIPGFILDGKVLIWYAGWKAHTSIYPVTAAMWLALGPQIEPFKDGRATLRFPLAAALPLPLVAKLVRIRAREIRAAQ